MSPRTLTDELRSVLLYHALESPEPNATVDRILNDTVGAVTALDAPDAGYHRPPRTGRRLWVQQLVAAAVVAVLLLAVAGINSFRNHRSGNEPGALVNQNGADQRLAGQAPAAGSMALPGASNGAQGKGGPVNPPEHAGKELDCTTIPGGRLVTGQWDDFTLPDGQTGYVYEFLCVGTDGQRSASEVQVFRKSGAALRYDSTLLYPAADLDVNFLVGGAGTVRIQTYVNSRWNGYSAGDVITTNWDLTAADPRASAGSGIALDASGVAQQREPGDPGCALDNLVVSVTPVAGAPAWRLALRNGAARACGFQGFPVVELQRAGSTLSTAQPTLNGAVGGVRSASVPPIIVLPPGATATAVIEQDSSSGSCPQSDRLLVTLPNGVALNPLPAQLPTCGLVVHPLVANTRGTD
ncbi:MAG: hypothetical protein QOE23_3161 [Pseudonocardiales bacterium]|jgi:hypothetical protein|nr:hypothetical protein [Pseudonocardiales bacterium]